MLRDDDVAIGLETQTLFYPPEFRSLMKGISTMSVLLTGGAGYIGSICVEELLRQNYEVIVIDNLQSGNRKAVPDEAYFYESDIGDGDELDKIFRRHRIQAVMHFAAEATVGLSMKNPYSFFHTNIVKGLTLLEIMKKQQCVKMIFSSSASIFGNPQYIPIDENHPVAPINPYGESKAMFEKVLDWYTVAYGFQVNSFRYFNAAGASSLYGEVHRNESHLIPLLIQTALGKRDKIRIFGSDYNTKDGTCIRDYIHVQDIALAHILALDNLDKNPNAKYNLANGKGFSNLEVLEAVARISGRKIPFEFANRRAGDPECLIATSQKAKDDLGWEPEFPSLEEIISSAWDWHGTHPEGY